MVVSPNLRRQIAGLMVVSMMLVGALLVHAQDVPTFEPADCMFEVPSGLNVDCGYLTVPAARDADGNAIPESGTMRLAVAVFHSSNPNPQPDPIVYLEGGPGGHALQPVPLTFESRFGDFLVDRDFIMFDQRGTGYSEPALGCPAYTDWSLNRLTDTRPLEAQLPESQAQIIACHDTLAAQGIDFTEYNSRESAQDLDDLREALGYDQWNLYGISYGTRLALTAMRDTPEHIRSVILDSAYPLEIDLYAETAAGAQRALNAFFEACAADEACAAAYPNLEQMFYDVVDRLNTTPSEVQTLTNPLSGESYDAVYTGDAVIATVFTSLYSEQLISLMPQMLTMLSEGDFATANLINGSLLSNEGFMSLGQQLAVQCNEEIALATGGATLTNIEVDPRVQRYFDYVPTLGQSISNLCDAWQAGTANEVENQPVTSDIPTLVMSGSLDPITPPIFGQTVAANLANSTWVEFPGVGHGASLSGDCPKSVALAFLDNPASELDTSCTAEMSIAFVLPSGDFTLITFENQQFGIQGVIPEGWQELAPGVYAESMSSTTVLIEQAVPGMGADQLVTLLNTQFGTSIGEPMGSYEGASLTFDLYQTSIQGLSIAVGIAESDGKSYLVIAQSLPSDFDTITETLFRPAMDALRALE